MDLTAVLAGSLKLLRDEPKAFVPRLATTLLYTLYAIYSLSVASGLYQNQDNPLYLQENAGRILLLIASAIALYAIDLVSYAMYPRIVEDHSNKKGISLSAALSSGLEAWPTLAVMGALIFALMIFVTLVTILFEVLYLSSGNGIYLALSLLSAIIILLTFAVLVFFVVPVAVIERKNAIESFAKSVRLGISHKKELFSLNAFFALLVIATMTLVALAEFRGEYSLPAISLFLAVRLIQAVIYTYISVTNPYIYLSLAEVNKVAPE